MENRDIGHRADAALAGGASLGQFQHALRGAPVDRHAGALEGLRLCRQVGINRDEPGEHAAVGGGDEDGLGLGVVHLLSPSRRGAAG